MKLRQALASALATTIAVTCFSMPTVAVRVFDTPQALIEDVLETSCAEVTSGTLSDAINTVKSGITISGDQVLYNEVPLGYWYADSSNTLWKDTTKSSAIIQEIVDGYDVLPTVLDTLLSDVNNQLIENYVPTSDDWSKIVGKYDITLGDVTIPADQWFNSSTFFEATGNDHAPTSIAEWNITQEFGIRGDTISEAYGDSALYSFAWLIDDNGDLYVQNGMVSIFKGSSSNPPSWSHFVDNLQSVSGEANIRIGINDVYDITAVPYVRAGLINAAGGYQISTYPKKDATHTQLMPILFVSDGPMSRYGAAVASRAYDDAYSTLLYKMSDPAIVNTCAIEDAKAYGIAFFTGAQVMTDDKTAVHTWHTKMFDSYSCAKLVRGNALLSKRLAKLDSLTQTDYLTIKNSGWYITDGSSIDDYIGNQSMLNAGDTADINAVAEVEPLMFKVIVPTTLPIYVGADGTVSTATNATVVNKSNAAVKITGVDITAKAESGWTLVQGSPSDVRDANEFTFTTSLNVDMELSRDEVLPFTYNAALSPMTEGVDSLDLATVSVTVDWAD